MQPHYGSTKEENLTSNIHSLCEERMSAGKTGEGVKLTCELRRRNRRRHLGGVDSLDAVLRG